MKFHVHDTFLDPIEINTLDELRAYALGGTGKIMISYVEHHPVTGDTLKFPLLSKLESK